MKVSIFLPIYNEERILERSVKKVIKSAKESADDFEIIIVDDSSKDGSQKIGEKLAKKSKKVKYIRYDNGPSRRENLADAFKNATGEIILFSDTDLAADITALKSLINAVKGRYDVAIGSRYLKNSETKRKINRRIISFFYNHFIRFYLKSNIHDHNCGFKSFKKKAILGLVADAGYDESFIRGWFWDAEILIRAQRKKLKVIEIAVRWIEPKKSTFSFDRERRMIPYILKLRAKLKQ